MGAKDCEVVTFCHGLKFGAPVGNERARRTAYGAPMTRRTFATIHPKPFDLHALDVVRIVEEQE